MAKTKSELLKERKYKYHFNREIYYNKNEKKIFSREVIEDNDKEWLSKKLNENNNDLWTFYFNDTPDDNVKNILIDEIEND